MPQSRCGEMGRGIANRGITLHALKRFEEALASLDRALALRPDNAEALGSREVTLHVLRRFERRCRATMARSRCGRIVPKPIPTAA